MTAELIKVLLVEDDENDYLLTRGLLGGAKSQRFEIAWAATYTDALAAVAASAPDVCLVSYHLGEKTGVELLEELNARGYQLPAILIASDDDPSIDLQAMKAGAADYLVKGQIDRPLLERSIRYTLRHSRALEALRASEAQYRLIVETTADGVWILDSQARTSYVNRRLAEMLGYGVDEIIARSVFDFMDDSESAKVAERIARRKQGVVEQYECLLRRRNGTDLWALISASPVNGPNGTFIGSLGMLTDITERKQAEVEQKRLAAIVESSDDAILSKTLDGIIISWNASAERMYGYAAEEAIGQHVAFLVPPERAAEHKEIMEKLRRGERISHLETWRVRKDGSRIDVSVSISPIRDDWGKITGVSTIARDNTERRQLEEQFRQAQRLEAIGRLAGGVAHDFNNLLTVINGYSELAMESLQPADPLRRSIQEINRAGERAAALTRQLLAFSRRQVMQPKVLDLNSIVADMEKMLRRLIGEDIELRTVLKPDLGSIKADPGQVEQVIMNLAVNARDAMPEGGKLVIETDVVYLDKEYAGQHIAVSPGAYVLLAVSDTGCGMNEETKARIFEPFFTTKELGQGTGLGLSTVYGIVKQSGGSIWAYSEVGRGTTFKVYLPLIDQEAEDYKRSFEPEEFFQGTETILLVEDEKMVRQLARDVLEMYGYHVLEAANGGSALLICEQYKDTIDLLLTDLIMPEMSGRTLASRLGQLRPEMKVLYMSGYTDNTIVHHHLLDSGLAFLQKPFTPVGLARKVREVLESGQNPAIEK